MWRLNGSGRTLEKHDVLFQYWLPEMVSPHTSCCNNLKFLQWQCCSLYCKRFFATNMSLFPFSLQPHWRLQLNQVLSAEHETPQQTATQDEGRSWYKIMLPDWICTKKPKRGSCDLAYTGLIRHYLSSKGSASVMSCWCQFPANKRVKKHAANSPVSMKMEPWPKSSFVWVVRYFR